MGFRRSPNSRPPGCSSAEVAGTQHGGHGAQRFGFEGEQGGSPGLVSGQQLCDGGAGVKPSGVVPQLTPVPVQLTVLVPWFQSMATLNVWQVKAGSPVVSQHPPTQTDTLNLMQQLEPSAGMAPWGFGPPPERRGPKKIGCDASKDSQQPVLTGASTPDPPATEPQLVPLA